jgi:hypothetical protein
VVYEHRRRCSIIVHLKKIFKEMDSLGGMLEPYQARKIAFLI